MLGIFIEPIGGISIFLLLFGFRRGFNSVLGVDLPIFLGAGILTFTLFNSIGRRALGAIKANYSLFFYRRVKPIDTLISRAILETQCYGTVYISIFSLYFIFKNDWMLQDIPLLFSCWLCTALIGFGYGLIMMVIGHRYILVEQGVNILSRPLFFLSAVLFPLSSIPQWLRPWLSWNPILQAIELSRRAFYGQYILDPLISLTYLLKCTITLVTIGLFIYICNERILITR